MIILHNNTSCYLITSRLFIFIFNNKIRKFVAEISVMIDSHYLADDTSLRFLFMSASECLIWLSRSWRFVARPSSCCFMDVASALSAGKVAPPRRDTPSFSSHSLLTTCWWIRNFTSNVLFQYFYFLLVVFKQWWIFGKGYCSHNIFTV